MEYRAIVKRDSENELRHWKYIKRIKKDGKWKYFYKDNNLRKHQIGLTETKKYKDKDGIDVKENITYKQTNKLFNGKRATEYYIGNIMYKKVTFSQGKISRAVAKAEKWIYDKVVSEQKKLNKPNDIKNNHQSDKRDKKSKDENADIIKKLNEKEKPVKKKKEIADVQAKTFSELPKKTREYTKEEDQKAVNPNYESGDRSYTRNCSYCTAAYELRRRGYDVETAPISETDDPPTTKELVSWYKDAEVVTMVDIAIPEPSLKSLFKKKEEITLEPEKNYEAIIDSLKQNGEGSRGNVNVHWKHGSGHSMVWEIENDAVVIRDCQTNKTYTETEIEELLGRTKHFEYYRTDNLEFNDEILKTVRYKRKG